MELRGVSAFSLGVTRLMFVIQKVVMIGWHM